MRRKNNSLPSPAFLGALFGFIGMTLLLEGGYDAGLYFLRDWWESATAPYWVFWVTQPFTWFGWPLAWTLLVTLTILASRYASSVWNGKWWVALFSLPMMWNLWLGQIEIFGILGAVIGWFVVQGRLSPYWLGISAVALITKPQVGFGLFLLYSFWTWRKHGFLALVKGGIVALGIVALTFILNPDWLTLLLDSLEQLNPADRYFSATVFPYGILSLVVIGLAFWRGADEKQIVRIVALATLLSSPYFAVYHLSTVLTMYRSRIALSISWLAILPAFIPIMEEWQRLGWISPLILLLWETYRLFTQEKSEIVYDPA